MSDEPKDGGQAFPALDFETTGGMSVRTWLAGQALAGMDVDKVSPYPDYSSEEWHAQAAVQVADATMRYLGLTEGGENG